MKYLGDHQTINIDTFAEIAEISRHEASELSDSDNL